MSQLGMILAASFRANSLDDLIKMDQIELDFLMYWQRQKEFDQMEQFGRLLGVLFNAGEVRGWNSTEDTPFGMDDEDNLLIPLSFMLRPESREGIQKLIGQRSGLSLPKEYKQKAGEIVVDLGKVSPEEFKAFVEKNRVGPKVSPQ